MTEISSSPERHTFQIERYVKRCEEEGKEPCLDYLNLYKSANHQDEENMVDPDWQKDNMEYDLRSTDWILEKVRSNPVYAQNLYAAMCNNDFQKLELFNVLSGKTWSCSWRHSGGIIADMRQEGDYIDWYCSGMGGLNQEYDDKETNEEWQARTGHVQESVVTDEIKSDLERLGWRVIPYDKEK